MDLIKINDKELNVKEYKGKRVVTFEDIANVHNVDISPIKQSYKQNKDKFEENKHTFLIEGDELKILFESGSQIGINNTHLRNPVVRVFTERGYLRLVKPMRDDVSWEVQEKLIDNYFRVKELTKTTDDEKVLEVVSILTSRIEKYKQQLKIDRPKADFYDAVTGSKDTISIGDVAKVLNMGIGRNNLFALLRSNEILMNDNKPYQSYVDKGHFRIIEQKYTKPDGETCISLKTVVYQSGVDYIRKVLTEHGYERQSEMSNDNASLETSDTFNQISQFRSL